MSTPERKALLNGLRVESRFLTPPSDQTEPDDLWLEPPPPSQFRPAKRRMRSCSPEEERPVKKERVDAFDSDVEIVDDGSDSDIEILVSYVYGGLRDTLIIQSQSHEPAPRLRAAPYATPPNDATPVKAELHPPTWNNIAISKSPVKGEYLDDVDPEPVSVRKYEDFGPPASQVPVTNFFTQEQHPGFEFDTTEPIMPQFRELVRQKGHMSRYEYNCLLGRFHDCIAEAFNIIYGTDADGPDAWYDLCTLLGCWNIPDDVEACKRVSFMRLTHLPS